MKKRTPGPWKLDGGVGKDGDLYVWQDCPPYDGGHGIATVHGQIKEGAAGNALLIIAAPDLLEACEKALDMLSDMVPEDNVVFQKLIAAYEKATRKGSSDES